MPASRLDRLRAKARAWNAERAAHGTRAATVLGIRRLLDLGPVTTGRVDQMSHQIDELVGRTEHLDQLSRGVAAAVEGAADAVVTTREMSAALVAHEHEARELSQQVWATTAWLEHVPVASDTVVSIVLPTRGTRPESLRQAVVSVVEQRHERWQLIVVVDGDEATLEAVTRSLPDDERIEVVRSPRGGVSAARNVGLGAARGDLVAYLDDDNLMGPLWTKALVWAAERHPEAEVFYGAELVDAPRERGHEGVLPTLHLAQFDRRRLERGNYLDQGVIAHRRTLADAQYDESLAANVDWDFLLRVTAERQPVMVPVIASYYRTGASDRLTGSQDAERSWQVVRARARDTAPLRVLAYNKMYPLISEQYIAEELDALARFGADIACCSYDKRSAPAPQPYPLYRDLERAIAEHQPDVLLVHWAPVAIEQRDVLQSVGLPYAVRGHSFANEPNELRLLLEDPLCVGVWALPRDVWDHPKVHSLPTLFTGWDRMPDPAATRDLVLSLSAGLPKKDFPLLLDAFASLPGVERRIVVGTTFSFEGIVGELVLAAQELDDPPLIQANLTRDVVFELLARTSVFVYTLRPDHAFGCPMSIVEGMTAGACIVAPDRAEVRATFGPDVRGYRTADDIVAHVREVLAGGPAIDAERERVREFAVAHFCDPDLGKRFYEELVDAVRAGPAAG